MAGLSDEAIIELYWKRDEQAVTETSDKYGAYCEKVAYNILSDHPESEECVNDTWLTTWNSIPPTRPSVLRAFLAKITRNLAINRYNAKRAQKRGGGEAEAALDELSEVLSGGGDPADEAAVRELGAAVNAFLRELPETERSIVIKRYFFAEAVKTIAEEYHLTPGNVSVMLSRSRAKLKSYLTERGYC